jgi:hypothetical protein
MTARGFDPDVGRRVLQCRCGAWRGHTDARAAHDAGWGSWWVLDRRIWFCPDCWVAPALPPASSAHFPTPSPAFLDLATEGDTKGRFACRAALERLCEIDPSTGHAWIVAVVLRARKPRLVREWSTWAAMCGIWVDPMIAMHLSKSVEHYSPAYIPDMFREVFAEDIELDPASCAQANTLVRAQRYFAEADNGLSMPWHARTVWLNPPGGNKVGRWQGKVKCNKVSQAALWWATLAHRFEGGQFQQAGFVIFNLETIRHAQNWPVRQPLDFSVCFPRERIDYYTPGRHAPKPQGSPAHPSALVYLGPNVARFREVFSPLGFISGK